MQRTFADRSADIAVYAISYDPIETLARFSDAHGIEYPLLGDAGSEVITRLGVLNVTMEQERAAYGRKMEDRHRGVPYPGTFFLDEDGVITGKRFEQSHRIRPTGRTLLRELVGDGGSPPEVSAEASSPGVAIAAWLDTAVVHANQLQEVHVRLDIDEGVHLYTEPVPEGFTALSLSLTGPDRLRPESIDIPTGAEFHVEGLSETFYVVEGRLDLVIPFILLSNRDTAGDASEDLNLSLSIGYQACTAEACFMPERLDLDLPLTEEPNPGYESADMAVVSPLVFRRIVEQPRSDAELLDLVNAALVGTEVGMSEIHDALDDLSEDGFIHPNNGTWARSPT